MGYETYIIQFTLRLVIFSPKYPKMSWKRRSMDGLFLTFSVTAIHSIIFFLFLEIYISTFKLLTESG